MTIKVAIYEDNTALLESLTFLIKGTRDFELCGAFSNANSIIDDCRQSLPEIILMDIDMPGTNGIEATVMLKESYPEINVMMLTVFEDKERIFEALCAGATGYLLKKSSAVQIIEAVKELYNGGSPISGEIARKVLEFFSKPHLAKTRNEYTLSPREFDILRCLVNGDSYKMVADKCFISIGTVYTHINNIYKKLHVNSKSEAVIKAIREKLL
jgi:two-component system, NarL family, response regulator LiaR